MEIEIKKVEHRATVAAILFENGYTVTQVKRKKPDSKSPVYAVKATREEDSVSTPR